MSDSVDHFCQQLDHNSSVGIHSTLSRLTEMLKVNDQEPWQHLNFTSKVNPQFYVFKWITLLLTQEFPFNSILRIWDSLLSNPSGVQDMLLRLCCAMLISVKSQLLSSDFAANLYLLQHYPEVDIEHLLQIRMLLLEFLYDQTSFGYHCLLTTDRLVSHLAQVLQYLGVRFCYDSPIITGHYWPCEQTSALELVHWPPLASSRAYLALRSSDYGANLLLKSSSILISDQFARVEGRVASSAGIELYIQSHICG